MRVVYFIIEILVGFVDIYLFYKTVDFFFKQENGKRRGLLLLIPLTMVTIKTILDWNQVPGNWSGICFVFLGLGFLLFALMVYDGSVLKKGIFTLFFIMLEMLSEIIVMLVGIPLFGLNIQRLQGHGMDNTFALLSSKVIFIFFLFVIRKMKQAGWNLQADILKPLFLMMAINISLLMLSYILYRNITSVTKEVLFQIMGCTIFFVAILNIVVFYSMMRASQKNYQVSLQLQYMQAQEQQNQNMETVTQNLRQLRHDMNNHMGVLYGLCDTKQYDTLQQYLQGIMQETKEANDIIVVPNQPVLSIILNNKRTLAEEKGISLTYATKRDAISPVVKAAGTLPLSEMEQCSLFGNILDNAIEACEKIAQVTERWIHLTLMEKEDGWLIVCKNTYLEKPVFKGDELITQKEDAKNHGIGTRTMRSIIKKYNGTLEYQVTEEEFQIEIFLCQK